MKRQIPGEQQQRICAGHQTGAKFALNLEKCMYFSGQTGSGNKGPPTRIIMTHPTNATRRYTNPTNATRRYSISARKYQ